MFGRLFAFFARAQTRHQLNALSDHQLRDIGLSRDQIDDVAQRMSEALAARRPLPGKAEPRLVRALHGT
jgi:Domain of unknown function (DUF1127)